MEYNFNEIEKKWQAFWKENRTYQVYIDKSKPKFYVLDMFPYPSGAGLHVGHPLGYIASDIYARYKRLKGFNVLHPMGYDAYGLPAEQYAIQTGQHPAITTEQNINRYREQLDKIGFSFDWDREVRTCDPEYYKWTQWAFIKMFESYYYLPPTPSKGGGECGSTTGCVKECVNDPNSHKTSDTALSLPSKGGGECGSTTGCVNDPNPHETSNTALSLPFGEGRGGVARPISELVTHFEEKGTEDLNVAQTEELHFTAEEWKAKPEKEKQETLMNYRIAYLADTTVNWCSDLGTVLANDEVSEGVSIRGGYPVEQRKMWQWSLRVSAYAQRLLDDLDKIDWTESLKETQRNWIGRSEGAELVFYLPSVYLPPAPSKGGGEGGNAKGCVLGSDNNSDSDSPRYFTTDIHNWKLLIDYAKQIRKEPTEAESILWDMLRGKQFGCKFRRQHPIDVFIPDFVCLEKKLIVEVDGEYHLTEEQKELDTIRTQLLNDWGYKIIRFSNDDVKHSPHFVGEVIKAELEKQNNPDSYKTTNTPLSLPSGEGRGGVVVFTTRADTIFGVTFMVLAPESEYVSTIVTPEQQAEVDAYLEAVKRRTERERIADRKVTGVFTGSYAINPVNGAEIPIWISDYVLAGYGTGAIMAVPAHDSRDYAFAKHFNLPIIPLIEGADISEESFDAKEGIMMNSGFLNGLTVKEAIQKAKEYIAENGLGKVKVNYRLRDAIFSRQRYWGEPFPIYYKDGMPYPVAEDDLPIELPEVDKFLPTETGEPPLGRAKNWEYAV